MKKTIQLIVVSILFSLLTAFCVSADDTVIVGKWKSIDDETGEPKSIVEIYETDGEYFGRIIELFRKAGEDPDPICDECPADDPRKDQPIKGMVIIKNLKKNGAEYSDGTILDPKTGKIYTSKLWVENGNLMVRGYIAFFFRTQTWIKAE